MGKKYVRIIFISMLVIFLCWIGVNKYQANFSREKWMEDPSNRVNIVDDLLSEYNLVGKSKAEVIKLLGAPTEQASSKTVNTIIYYLGPEKGFPGIDIELLVIELDDNGEVIKYETHTS
ncbi:hypothetical protein [Bacillus sp. EAC]|uniref:hypothetical protein n=1 Tax=Bacillus sp. EAC TaxID=1978338 RepID=UPI000B433558|nr:hypothetical protein [Bacillus sp. EAC]